MIKKLRFVLAQLNLTVGDIKGNLAKHIAAAKTARDQLAADVIIFPELSLTGYPPEDLLFRTEFIEAAHIALQDFMSEVNDIYCLVSHPHLTSQGLLNSCSLIYNGNIIGRYAKQFLPNYDVFDEHRYFVPGNAPCVVAIKNVMVGLVICEDLWHQGPVQQAALQGARVILSPNASPFEDDKFDKRVAVLSKRAKQEHIPILYANSVGGQDELIFDGGSMAVDEDGNVSQFAGFFNETLMPVDIDITATQSIITSAAPYSVPTTHEKIYNALVLSVRDYIRKNHFPGILIGLSGGIDSALTLAIAVDALGKECVEAVIMPSRYTADISNDDAHLIALRLGVKTQTISIEPVYQTLLESLAESFKGKKADLTEENLQSRCRAIILMALSNKTGKLVLTTGNRSELAVGYCTIYGDMAGGFAPIKDVPKGLVYALAKYRNTVSPVIPERTIERPPTAELALNQKDEDSLPPYPILDGILEAYLNQNQTLEEIVGLGYDVTVVKRVINLIRKNEYKRRQGAVGPRINLKAFGKDWRFPITNGF